jgi:hypothetical protein
MEVLKGKDSFFAPFIGILPDTFSNPTYWEPSELEEIQDRHMLDDTKDEIYWMTKSFQIFTELAEKENVSTKGLNLEIYRWATTVYQTRCFELNSSYVHTLVPMADLLNHDETSSTTWQVRDEAFVMFADQGGFSKGSQVYNNYGGDFS